MLARGSIPLLSRDRKGAVLAVTILVDTSYSARSAIIGSILDALRAGK